MNSLWTNWQRCKPYLLQAEAVYQKLSEKYEDPPPWMLFLPVAYQFLSENPRLSGTLDEHGLILLGQYFSTRHPALKEHFTTAKQRASVSEMRDTINSFFEERS